MRVEGVRQPAGEPVGQGKSPSNQAEIVRAVDPAHAATLRAVARSVHRGAWWRSVRRNGIAGAPGAARTFGILVVLLCLAMGEWVSLSGSPGLFRGDAMTERVVRRARQASRRPLSPSGQENGAMRAMNLSMAVVSLLFASGASFGQAATEWKVSAGGNGHWYGFANLPVNSSWANANAIAAATGAHLTTITSDAENRFVVTLSRSTPGAWITSCYRTAFGPLLGGYQDRLAPDFSEPDGGWRWVTGEPWGFVDVSTGGFNNFYCLPIPGVACLDNPNQSRAEDFVQLAFDGTGWNDVALDAVSCVGWLAPSVALEWDADCNGDGSVDYGQILSGELPDANGNFIPDCCEQGGTCPVNVAVNGSFEAGTPLNACTSETVASGDALGTGWMVTAGSVQRVRASATCATQGAPKFGDFFVDLLNGGEIRQAVATTPGRGYRLTFWLSGDCAGGPTTKRVTATLGSAAQNFDHACSGTGSQAWRSCSVEFIANASVTTLSLKSAVGGASNGPLVDGVRVEDISISCPGDVDGDGEVTGGDVGLVLLNFGACPGN